MAVVAIVAIGYIGIMGFAGARGRCYASTIAVPERRRRKPGFDPNANGACQPFRRALAGFCL